MTNAIPPRAFITLLLDACDAEFDALLTVGDHLGRLQAWLPPHRRKHDHSACLACKRTAEAACIVCESSLRPRFAATASGPFVKICHAGFAEVVVPVWPEEPHAATLALGLFRHGPGRGELPILQQEGTPLPVARGLRLLTTQAAQQKAAVLAGLAAAFRELHALHAPRAEQDDARAARIARFLDTHFRRNVRLGELAGALHLSSTRAGHTVRETLGTSFREAVKARRLDYARTLLERTALPVAEVSALAGFPEPRQLYLAFREWTSETPLRWRKRHRQTPEA